MKYAAAGVSVILVFAATVSGQVHFREKAVISPLQSGRIQTGGDNHHAIGFEFYWDTPIREE